MSNISCRYVISEEDVRMIEYLVKGIVDPTAVISRSGWGPFPKWVVEEGDYPLGSHPNLFVQGVPASCPSYGTLSKLGLGLRDLLYILRSGGREVLLSVESTRALGILGFKFKHR